MMTPDDGGNHGNTQASQFPARIVIRDFCGDLRKHRAIDSITALPKITGASYSVQFHKGDTFITNKNRVEYFSGLLTSPEQVILLDPDNGFEPEKSKKEKHVCYDDISNILDQISVDSVISVFHHHRRKSFIEDFARIKERLYFGSCTAIYWHSLMFVAAAKSDITINRVVTANQSYASSNPAVKVII